MCIRYLLSSPLKTSYFFSAAWAYLGNSLEVVIPPMRRAFSKTHCPVILLVQSENFPPIVQQPYNLEGFLPAHYEGSSVEMTPLV